VAGAGNQLRRLQLPHERVSNIMTTEPSTIAAADKRWVFHSWSAQAHLDPVAVVGGDGAWFWDDAGTRFLDFSSQLINLNLGHQHPGLIAGIASQLEQVTTIAPSFANETRAEAARLIVEHSPITDGKVFFTNGGADANEHAVRMARLHTGRHKVLATYRSYHGATAGSIALTGDPRRWANEPAVSGVVHFRGPYPYRSSFHAASPAEECERAVAHLDETLIFEGPEHVAAIVLETVTGTNGVLVPPDGYLAEVRALCDRYGILLICDEVMCGFGRCGRWFAVDEWQVRPDLITFAKGVNSGYVPLGGVVISPAVASTFDHRPYPGGLTYSGHPLACAAAVASINILNGERLIERSRQLGHDIIGPRLADMAARHRSVGDVRGLGCFWAIELVSDPERRTPLVPYNASGAAAKPMAEIAAACRTGGVWPFVHFNRTHIAPPLVISDEDLHRGLDVIDDALELADRYVTD
jgi:taurine--2-oxoglutarate transaminase